MRTIKSFLIALAVLGTAAVATINVVVNGKAPITSNLTLQNLEAFTQESGESGIVDVDPNKCDTKAEDTSFPSGYHRVNYTCTRHDVSPKCKSGWSEYSSNNVEVDGSYCYDFCNRATYQ
jgi:hypothetical protein